MWYVASPFSCITGTVVWFSLYCPLWRFFPAEIIFGSSRQWLLDCSLLLAVAAVPLIRGTGIECAVQVTFIKESSPNLSLSLEFQRCRQNKADVTGLAQSRAVVSNGSVRLSEDLLVTLQSRTDAAGSGRGPVSVTVLQGCSQEGSGLRSAVPFPIGGTNRDSQVQPCEKTCQIPEISPLKELNISEWGLGVFFFIKLYWVLVCGINHIPVPLMFSSVPFPIKDEQLQSEILKYPPCHLWLAAHLAAQGISWL